MLVCSQKLLVLSLWAEERKGWPQTGKTRIVIAKYAQEYMIRYTTLDNIVALQAMNSREVILERYTTK